MTISGVAQIETPVLVLNQNYQPLNICSARRALVLMGHGKAESIVNGHGDILPEIFDGLITIKNNYTIDDIDLSKALIILFFFPIVSSA